MNDTQREKLAARYWQAEDRIRAIHAGKVIHGNSVPTERQLLKEQDEIEFLLGKTLLRAGKVTKLRPAFFHFTIRQLTVAARRHRSDRASPTSLLRDRAVTRRE